MPTSRAACSSRASWRVATATAVALVSSQSHTPFSQSSQQTTPGSLCPAMDCTTRWSAAVAAASPISRPSTCARSWTRRVCHWTTSLRPWWSSLSSRAAPTTSPAASSSSSEGLNHPLGRAMGGERQAGAACTVPSGRLCGRHSLDTALSRPTAPRGRAGLCQHAERRGLGIPASGACSSSILGSLCLLRLPARFLNAKADPFPTWLDGPPSLAGHGARELC
mmetsp:Transcript_8575/g.24627  ORF Transcript_8575/g.24627 Transcript_8575/m.24627 type:complete len:222 (+) Transcript_8575:1013-1678(+)